MAVVRLEIELEDVTVDACYKRIDKIVEATSGWTFCDTVVVDPNPLGDQSDNPDFL